MLTLTAAHARRVRVALKPVAASRQRGHPPPAVAFAHDGTGVVARLDCGEVYVALSLPGLALDAPVTVPWPVLAGPAGAAGFTAIRRGAGVEVRWREGNADRSVVFPAAPVAPLPESPGEWADNPADLFAAIAEATGLTADHPARFALHRLQLRGGPRGQVVATDGKALLVWGGFEFPWPGDVLVPAVRLAADGKPTRVRVGRTDRHVVLAAGGLTVWLAADTTGRYPEAASVIPPDTAVRVWCRFGADALKGMPALLDRLPGGRTADAPVTLDLGDRAVLRASVEDGPPAEEVLAGATVEGGPARVAFDRGNLRRACRLGLNEIGVVGPAKPVLARDARRTLLWVAHDPALAVESGEERPVPEERKARATARKPRARKPEAVPVAAVKERPTAAKTVTRPRPLTGVPAVVSGLLTGVAWLGRMVRDARRRNGDG